MLDVHGRKVTHSGPGMGRRDFLRVGALGATGLTLTDWFRLKAHAETQEPKAKSVIQLWMGGGPTHLDTFDPKPEAGEDYCGPLKSPVQTNVPGIRISEMLPLLAKQADKYSIIRSMVVGHNGHEIATYIMQTGTMPSDLVYPSIGAVVAYKREEAGYQGSLPPYISLTYPFGRFSEAGFLGTAYKTFATGGDPNSNNFRVQGLGAPGGVTQERMKDRRTLLQAVDSLARQMDNNKTFETMDSYQERAYGLILGDAKKAFDLSEEKDELREKYGRNRFGQSCLVARRLVEHGVPFVMVLGRMGYAPRQLRADEGPAASARPRVCRALGGPGRAGTPGEHDRHLVRRVRQNAQDRQGGPVGWRAPPLRALYVRRGRRRRIQRRDGGRPERRKRRTPQGAAGLSLGPHGQHVHALGH